VFHYCRSCKVCYWSKHGGEAQQLGCSKSCARDWYSELPTTDGIFMPELTMMMSRKTASKSKENFFTRIPQGMEEVYLSGVLSPV
jgi:hypothetical protein